jgi:hypothetical protein
MSDSEQEDGKEKKKEAVEEAVTKARLRKAGRDAGELLKLPPEERAATAREQRREIRSRQDARAAKNAKQGTKGQKATDKSNKKKRGYTDLKPQGPIAEFRLATELQTVSRCASRACRTR